VKKLLINLGALCAASALVVHGQEPTLAASIATNGSTQIQGNVRSFGTLFPPPPPGFVHEKTVIWNIAKRPHMGVQLRELSEQLAKFFHVEKGGVLVEAVESGGPADKAGVKAGDIITRLGDAVIAGTDELFKALEAHSDGDEVTVALVRREKRWEVKLTLEEGRVQSSTMTLSDGGEGAAQGGNVTYGQQQMQIDIQKLLGSMRHPVSPITFPGHASAREQEALRKELNDLKREMQELRKTLQLVRESTANANPAPRTQ